MVIDDSLFEDETGSPADFDNKPYHVYNIFPDAALLNFNAHEFIIVPEMNTVRVYIDPPSDNLKIDNRLKLVKGGCYSSKNTMIMHVFDQGNLPEVKKKRRLLSAEKKFQIFLESHSGKRPVGELLRREGIYSTDLARIRQKVKQGDVIVVLEAMKMETDVRAPRDGTVMKVAVKEGDSVALKDALLYIG